MHSTVHELDFQIIGGQNADIGEYPWMAEMYYFNLPSCAATLISEDYILTAAQCVDGVSRELLQNVVCFLSNILILIEIFIPFIVEDIS